MDNQLFLHHLNDALSKKNNQHILLAAHYSPDGDAVGSCLAIGEFLASLGHTMIYYNADPIPYNLKFLIGSAGFTSSLPEEPIDITILLDCARFSRSSKKLESLPHKGITFCIDHHETDDSDATYARINSRAASTGMIIYELLCDDSATITPTMAQALYTTIAVDTGFFKYPNTNATVLNAAGKLVELGANAWEVAKCLQESQPIARMRLLAMSLGSLSLQCNDVYASMDVTQAMLSECHATKEMSDEFATYPRAIDSVEVAAFFRELKDGSVKVSLRSKDYVDVASIATHFDGGGHKRAAGFRVNAPLNQVKELVLKKVMHAVHE